MQPWAARAMHAASCKMGHANPLMPMPATTLFSMQVAHQQGLTEEQKAALWEACVSCHGFQGPLLDA